MLLSCWHSNSVIQTVALRSNFNPLAVFAPEVRTGRDVRARQIVIGLLNMSFLQGKGSVKFVLPDNLTRYRVMAVAVSDSTSYGNGETAIVAAKPLMIRPAPPRYALPNPP